MNIIMKLQRVQLFERWMPHRFWRTNFKTHRLWRTNLKAHLQLPMQQVVNALRQGAAGSWALEHRSQAMLNDDYPLGFKLALHHKDLGIALDAALQTGLKLPITEAVHDQEQALMDAGLGDADVSALRRSLPANPYRAQQLKD